jgi:hypothetical protein
MTQPAAQQDQAYSGSGPFRATEDRLAPRPECRRRPPCRDAGQAGTFRGSGVGLRRYHPGEPSACQPGLPAGRMRGPGQPLEVGRDRGRNGFGQRQDVPLRLGAGGLIRRWGGCRHDPQLSTATPVQPGVAIRVAPGGSSCADTKRGRSRAAAATSWSRGCLGPEQDNAQR